MNTILHGTTDNNDPEFDRACRPWPRADPAAHHAAL